VRLAVVDDASFVRLALPRVFQGHASIEVVGCAASGEELLANLSRWRPDVITLDLSMPGMGGMATLERVMAVRPVPVIILSSHSARDAPLTMEALSRGAADFVDKQELSLVDFQNVRALLSERILAVARPSRSGPPSTGRPGSARERTLPPAPGGGRFQALLLGASTGGPPVIERILEALGPDLAVPVGVVQHMPAGFTAAFAERLSRNLPFPVREATHGAEFAPGVVHMAPAGRHLRLRRDGRHVTTVLTAFPDAVPHRPSVDLLFSTAAEALGGRVVAALLTGMGKDGAEGMAALRRAGAHTLGQAESSCVVYGMPQAARALGATMEELDEDDLGARLRGLLQPVARDGA
jgi:two-component system chemotaxis response regulator CheB